MIMQSQKMAVNPSCSTQQQRLRKDRGLSSFNLYKLAFGIIIVMVVFLLSMASAKPSNSCTETQFSVHHEDGSISCEDCPSCNPGRTLSPECGKRVPSSAMVKCVHCPSGVSFSSKRDTSSCTPCSSCSKDQVVLRNCTPQWNIKCAKQCYSKDRYYDDDKGDCFACSRCCGDDQDVVEEECKGKLGAGSSMICSIHSSVNRCEKSTTSPQTLSTIINQSSTTNTYTSPSRGSKREHTVPLTTQSTGSLRLSQRKDLDFWTAASIPVVILVLLVCCGCFYFFKKRQVDTTSFWCNDYRDAERRNRYSVTEAQHSLDKKAIKGEAKEILAKIDTFYRLETFMSPESMEPLLKEGVSMILTCSCEIESKKDSKLLCSLLQHESDDVQKIYDRLDTKMPGHGHYRAVALYHGLDHYQIASGLDKNNDGPSRALIEWLAAAKPELTVREFVTVVRKEAKRNDVAKLLEDYDAN